MASANPALVRELVRLGLERREAGWIVEEFAPDGDRAAEPAALAAAQRRLAGEPLQYVIGHWPFRTLDLDLDPRVLIPRPETEMVVDVIVHELSSMVVSAPAIMDLGCGSGAIGLSVLVELNDRGIPATLIGVDVDGGALEVARRNAVKHQMGRASFVQSSWFDSVDDSLRGRLNLIVANPPYIGADEFELLDPVLRHEPYRALVARDADGVVGFAELARIIEAAPGWLAPDGVLVCEHGSEQGRATVSAADRAGLSMAGTVRDLTGRDRFLVARGSP